MLWRPAVLGLIVLVVGAMSAGAADRSEGLAIYSKLHFNSAEGEYIGLQVVLATYGYGETKLLWRSGTGALDEPLLLDVVQVGNKLHVHVPEGNDYSGDWLLIVRNGVMTAEGPRKLHFVLQRLQVH